MYAVKGPTFTPSLTITSLPSSLQSSLKFLRLSGAQNCRRSSKLNVLTSPSPSRIHRGFVRPLCLSQSPPTISLSLPRSVIQIRQCWLFSTFPFPVWCLKDLSSTSSPNRFASLFVAHSPQSLVHATPTILFFSRAIAIDTAN